MSNADIKWKRLLLSEVFNLLLLSLTFNSIWFQYKHYANITIKRNCRFIICLSVLISLYCHIRYIIIKQLLLRASIDNFLCNVFFICYYALNLTFFDEPLPPTQWSCYWTSGSRRSCKYVRLWKPYVKSQNRWDESLGICIWKKRGLCLRLRSMAFLLQIILKVCIEIMTLQEEGVISRRGFIAGLLMLIICRP